MPGPGWGPPPPCSHLRLRRSLRHLREGTGEAGWAPTESRAAAAPSRAFCVLSCCPGLARQLWGNAPAWAQPSAKMLTHAYISWVTGLTLGCPPGRQMCPRKEGDLLLFGPSAFLAWRMYFGVGDRLHLLSQKQVWSSPSGLQPQGKCILNLLSARAGQGHWHGGPGRVPWEGRQC